MLYLSRVIDTERALRELNRDVEHPLYGVVDTDDDVEEFVTYDELIGIVHYDGITIEGVVPFMGCGIAETVAIIPYQDMRYATKSQVKTKVLLGVDIRVFKGEIAHIIVNTSVAPDSVRIKLSDFGSYIGNAFYVDFTDGPRKSLVLCFDDKIQFDNPFVDAEYMRDVYFDMSLVSDSDVLYSLAKRNSKERLSRVIDNRGRIGVSNSSFN